MILRDGWMDGSSQWCPEISDLKFVDDEETIASTITVSHTSLVWHKHF
jgi:hypothetical protein